MCSRCVDVCIFKSHCLEWGGGLNALPPTQQSFVLRDVTATEKWDWRWKREWRVVCKLRRRWRSSRLWIHTTPTKCRVERSEYKVASGLLGRRQRHSSGNPITVKVTALSAPLLSPFPLLLTEQCAGRILD